MYFILKHLFAVAAMVLTTGAAAAADCVDTAHNNPAFSNSYTGSPVPCPPNEVKPVKPAPATKTVSPSDRKSPVDGDKPVVTRTESGGLVIRSGETTVCVHGSIEVDMVTHGGRLRPSSLDPKDKPCD